MPGFRNLFLTLLILPGSFSLLTSCSRSYRDVNKPEQMETRILSHVDVSRLSIILMEIEGTPSDTGSIQFSRADLEKLRRENAIGNVCGMHFTIDGRLTSLDFQSRLVTISADDLLAIDLRLGVAGGPGKVEAILGALRGGFINVLVTDNYAATQLLELIS